MFHGPDRPVGAVSFVSHPRSWDTSEKLSDRYTRQPLCLPPKTESDTTSPVTAVPVPLLVPIADSGTPRTQPHLLYPGPYLWSDQREHIGIRLTAGMLCSDSYPSPTILKRSESP